MGRGVLSFWVATAIFAVTVAIPVSVALVHAFSTAAERLVGW